MRIFPSSSSLLRQVRLWENYFLRFSESPSTIWQQVPTDVGSLARQNRDVIVRQCMNNVGKRDARIEVPCGELLKQISLLFQGAYLDLDETLNQQKKEAQEAWSSESNEALRRRREKLLDDIKRAQSEISRIDLQLG